ncbi:right-handed parallel beta-helix repeat-containing protein [uncultured Maribacter sp.]|uniref:right-handed parallel beta-helix repeat-containing protein n=1 Tax=uncultured Maribacter sp. TaxID=431308 RepID=UPI00262DE944|nr:right-handed parallel beta-helix repeat-containing protein [uncultured Maribacter sp.]
MARITFKPMYFNTTVFILLVLTFPLLQLGSCSSDHDILSEAIIKDTLSEESGAIPILRITDFSILSTDNIGLNTDIIGVIDEEKNLIYVDIDTSSISTLQLKPTITVDSASTVIPDTTTPQDFSEEVTYTITTENGAEENYTVIPTIVESEIIEPEIVETPCSSNRQDSGSIIVTENNQRIENLHIKTSNQHGIEINGFTGVVISNCIIEYTGAYMGIKFSEADNLTIENCSITYTDAPSSGPLADATRNCIEGFDSQNLVITHVKVEDGSTGIRLDQCDESVLTYIEGHNMRGPFPRGQLVQYDKCIGGLLENFSVINDREIAWTEDNISIYKSAGQQIKKGLIVGNNSPRGVGVMFEDQNTEGARGGTGGLVEDVDFLEMGNGVASSVEGSGNVTFNRLRAKEIICGELGQGRGIPESNSLIFAAFETTGGNKITDCLVYESCNPTNIIWPEYSFEVVDYRDDIDFEPRAPIVLDFGCSTDN